VFGEKTKPWHRLEFFYLGGQRPRHILQENKNQMNIKKIISICLLLLVLMLGQVITSNVLADQPPDPGTGGPGTGDIPVGGGTPIDGGLIVLVSLGVTYGIKKIVQGIQSKNK